jgi:hypothetical protein
MPNFEPIDIWCDPDYVSSPDADNDETVEPHYNGENDHDESRDE